MVRINTCLYLINKPFFFSVYFEQNNVNNKPNDCCQTVNQIECICKQWYNLIGILDVFQCNTIRSKSYFQNVYLF